jgi:heat shock protein HslJ
MYGMLFNMTNFSGTTLFRTIVFVCTITLSSCSLLRPPTLSNDDISGTYYGQIPGNYSFVYLVFHIDAQLNYTLYYTEKGGDIARLSHHARLHKDSFIQMFYTKKQFFTLKQTQKGWVFMDKHHFFSENSDVKTPVVKADRPYTDDQMRNKLMKLSGFYLSFYQNQQLRVDLGLDHQLRFKLPVSLFQKYDSSFLSKTNNTYIEGRLPFKSKHILLHEDGGFSIPLIIQYQHISSHDHTTHSLAIDPSKDYPFVIKVISINDSNTLNEQTKKALLFEGKISDTSTTLEALDMSVFMFHPIALIDGKWDLIRLNQHPVEYIRFPHTIPSIDFQKSATIFTGFDGCNQLFGNISFKEGGQLEFKGIPGSTKKYCKDTDDVTFLSLFIGSTQYVIKGNTLTLSGEEGSLTFLKSNHSNHENQEIDDDD